MFGKLLRNLPYNPSLIGEVSFYANRLRSESAIRRLGLLFIVLSMLVQVFAYTTPPDRGLAARPSGNDIIYGGVANTDLKEIKQNIIRIMGEDPVVAAAYAYYGITSDVINKADTTVGQISMGDAKYRSVGRWSFGKGDEIARTHNGVTFYERNLKDVAIDPTSTEAALMGTLANGQHFAILLSCGNPVLDQTPPPPKPVSGYLDSVTCDVIAGWAYDPRRPEVSIDVHVYIDGQLQYPAARADQPRSDVNASGIPGNHGYFYPVPAKYKDDKLHSVHTYAIEDASARGATEGNSLLIGSPRSFTCPSPTTPPPPPPPDNNIQVCRDSKIITIKESERRATDTTPEHCNLPVYPKFNKSKTAKNLTTGIADANKTTAKPGDRIEYTLITTNTGDGSGTIIISENLSDVLEYSEYESSDHGTLDTKTGIITWGEATIAPGTEVRHTVIVKVDAKLASSVQGSTSSNSDSFDLNMNNVYGNTVDIKLPPPPVKVIEKTNKEMPKTGPGSTILIGFMVTVFVSYFYSRNRLLATELTIVRHDFAAGGL